MICTASSSEISSKAHEGGTSSQSKKQIPETQMHFVKDKAAPTKHYIAL